MLYEVQEKALIGKERSMQNLATRAHLPAVRFAPRAYMGCGGWDLARAPETAAPSLEEPLRRRQLSAARIYAESPQPEGTCPHIVYEPPEGEENNLSGRRRVIMGCGDELCEECEAKRRADMGCAKCKRIRKRAMMQEELEGSRMGQASYTLPALVTGGLVVFGLFYLATR